MGYNECRIALFPHGPPSRQTQTKCKELLIYCDADVQRFHDSSWSSLQQFIRYISRIDEIKEPIKQPLIVFTQTLPIQYKIIQARKEIVCALPHLHHAVWIVFVDRSADPSFERFAVQYGDVDQEIDNVPIWQQDQNRYLIITPNVTDVEYLQLRARTIGAQADGLLGKSVPWNKDPPSSTRLKVPPSLRSRTLTGLTPVLSKAS